MKRVHRWNEPVIVLVSSLLSGLLLLLSSMQPTQLVLEMGADALPRNVQLSGFHDPEQHTSFTFRWTQARAQVRLPSTEWNRPLRLDVQVLALPDSQGQLPTLTVFLEQQVLGQTQVVPLDKDLSEPYHYTFLVPARSFLLTEYCLTLESPTMVPGEGDSRALGVVVKQITLTSMPGLGYPPLPHVLAMLSIAPLVYSLGRLLRWPKRTMRFAAAEIVMLLAVALVAAPLDMAAWLIYLVGGLAAAGLLAFFLPRIQVVLQRAGAARFAAIENGLPPATSTAGTTRWPIPWADLGAIAVFLIAILVFFYPVVLQGKVFWGMDISDFFYPTRAVLGQALREGNLGSVIWNPYIFGGYPLLAEGQTGTFYPLNWLFALSGIPLSIFLTLHLLLHYFLAATFTYLYARTLRIGRPGAVLSGLTYAFSSFMIAHLQHVSLQNAATWLPLLFLFAELLLTRRRWTFLILTGLTLSIQICAGHPQAALICLLGLAIYLFARLLLFPAAPPEQTEQPRSFFDPWRRISDLSLPASNLIRFCSIIGLIAVLGMALAAVQLLPLYELIDHSIRAGGISYEWASTYALSPEEIPTAIFPFRFGGVADYMGRWNFAELAFYAGIAPLVLTIASVLKPNRYILLFFFLGGVTLLLAMGDTTPLFNILHSLPIYSGLRAPSRFVLLVDFSLAMLAGFGLTVLQKAPLLPKARNRSWFYAALLLFLVVVVIGPGGVAQVAWKTLVPPQVTPVTSEAPYQIFFPLTARNADFGASPLRLVADLQSSNPYRVLPWLLLLMSLSLAALGYRWKKTWVALLFIILLLVDLAAFSWRVNSPVVEFRHSEVPGESVEQMAAFLASKGNRFYAYRISDWPTNELMSHEISFLDGYSPLALSRHSFYDSRLRSQPANVSLLSTASVRYLVNWPAWRNSTKLFIPQLDPPIFDQKQVRIQENPDALPRAYTVYSATVVPPRLVLQTLAQPGWDSTAAAILEEPAPLPPPSGAVVSATNILRHEPTYVEIHVSSSITGLLVLNDTYYPGWAARVDGVPTPIYRANYLFRAVLVPPGDHTVVFVYRPLTLYVGLAITALAAIGTMGACSVLALRNRRTRVGRTRRGPQHAVVHCDSNTE